MKGLVNDMKDERVKQAYDQIMSEFARAVFFFALAAFLVKIIGFHKSLEDCVTEYVIIIAAPIFQAVRARQLKLSFYQKGMEKSMWIKTMAVLAVVAVFYGIYIWKKAAQITSLLPLAAFIAAFVLIRILVVFREKRRAKRLEKEFDQ